MSKIEVNEISKTSTGSEIAVTSDVALSNGLKTDTISEKTADTGVTIDGVKLKDNAVETDTISEKTSDTGVTIDGVLIKDGLIDGVDVSTLGVDTNTIKQVVYRESTTEYQRTSTTLETAADFHVLITPTSTTNKIYVEASMDVRNYSSTDGGYSLWYKSTDGGVTYSAVTNSATFFYATGNGHRQHYMNFHDTAGTTNEIRYQMYIRSWGGANNGWNYSSLGASVPNQQVATFTAMEYSV
jgi:hypothetical protein